MLIKTKLMRLTICSMIRFALLCLLTLVPTIRSAIAQQGEGASSSQPKAPTFRLDTNKGSVKAPFELFQNNILLQFRINNSRPIWFVFDTGASLNVINENLARKFGLAIGRNTTVEGLGGATAGFVAKDVTISLPGIEAYKQAMVAVPLDQLSAIGREMGGLIGNNFIMNFVVEIDYANRTITFYDRKGYNLSRERDALSLEARDGLPFVKVELSLTGRDTTADQFLIDTGSDRAFHVNRPFAEAHQLMAALSGASTVEAVGEGTGGQTRFTEVRISSLRLGGYTINSPIISISQDKEGIGAGDQPGIIGTELLRRFTLVLDYQAQRMLLKPNNYFSEPFEIDMSGLDLTTKVGDFKVIQVKNVRSHSPADEAGLREGDVIVTVSGRPAAVFGLDKLTKMFRQEGKEYLLRVKRGEKVVTARVKMRRSL